MIPSQTSCQQMINVIKRLSSPNPPRRPRGERVLNKYLRGAFLAMLGTCRALSLKRCLRSRPSFAIDPPALNSICVADDSRLWKSAATNYSQIMGNTAFGDSSNSMSGDCFYSTSLMFSLIFLQKHNGVVFMAGCSEFDHTENVNYSWCMTSYTSKFCKIVALLINNNNISWREKNKACFSPSQRELNQYRKMNYPCCK